MPGVGSGRTLRPTEILEGIMTSSIKQEEARERREAEKARTKERKAQRRRKALDRGESS